MKNVTRLAEVELEAKVDAAVKAEIAKGRNPADIGDRELYEISKAAYATLSPAAKRQAAEEGLLHMAWCLCGSYIAAKMWDAGYGWDATESQIVECGNLARIAPDDILTSLAAFREDHTSLTMDEAKDYPVLQRFLPLFVLQPDGTTLGEAAVKKAARGDKLALSFLAWKEVA